MFSEMGLEQRIPTDHPQRIQRALLVLILFIRRRERQHVEQFDYNSLFRCFVCLGMNDAVWDRTVFSINCDCLLDTDIARQFCRRALHLAE
ncbi:transposase [Methyloversatilis discipulorum]|uniref:transposase n=1 Tax=Methyloversatilis discipulorum TaxID=1119528 RepID=UPI001A37E58A|nr:transposase [Methyloversatilis discipulorum]MBL8468827.1 transposase [Methyloversatilis discipulorum]